MQHDVLLKTISETIAETKLIDAHCHIAAPEKVKEGIDVFKLFGMFSGSTLLSAGMSETDFDKLSGGELDLDAKWKLFQTYWEKVFNTGYARQFLRATSDLYGIYELNRETYSVLSAKITQAYRQSPLDWYRCVLKEKAGIDRGILDNGTMRVDPESFFPAYRFESRRIPEHDRFITVRTREDLEKIEEHYGREIICFQDFLALFEEAFAKRVSEGMVAVKLLLAVFRPLDIPMVTQYEAEAVFNSIMTRYKPNGSQQFQNEGPGWKEIKVLQDFIVHQLLRHAAYHRIPVQIHAGFQLGRRNILANSDPKLLNETFIQYQNVNFIILHSAMPYSYDLAFMAKNFHNVFMDFSWTRTLSPAIAKRLLSEVLELLPAHKMIGFGCDNSTVEAAYSEALAARRGLSEILAEKVESGYFTLTEALDFARKVLRQNAIDLYRLPL